MHISFKSYALTIRRAIIGNPNIGPTMLVVDRYTKLDALHSILDQIQYKDWQFSATVDGSLRITVVAPDNLNPDETISITHWIPMPDDILWEAHLGAKEHVLRFILDCIIRAETHEACEIFTFEGRQPFFPDHTPGGDPYAIVEK